MRCRRGVAGDCVLGEYECGDSVMTPADSLMCTHFLISAVVFWFTFMRLRVCEHERVHFFSEPVWWIR